MAIQYAARTDELFRNGEINLAEKEEAELRAAQARDRMILSNLRLVVNIAKNYLNRGMSLADLVEEGNIGLLRGVEGYDPTMDTRFSTYASWWIRQGIERAIMHQARLVRLPVHVVRDLNQVLKARRALQAAGQRSEEERAVTIEEIAEAVGRPAREVSQLLRYAELPSSLDAPLDRHQADGNSESVLDGVADDEAAASTTPMLHGGREGTGSVVASVPGTKSVNASQRERASTARSRAGTSPRRRTLEQLSNGIHCPLSPRFSRRSWLAPGRSRGAQPCCSPMPFKSPPGTVTSISAMKPARVARQIRSVGRMLSPRPQEQVARLMVMAPTTPIA